MPALTIKNTWTPHMQTHLPLTYFTYSTDPSGQLFACRVYVEYVKAFPPSPTYLHAKSCPGGSVKYVKYVEYIMLNHLAIPSCP